MTVVVAAAMLIMAACERKPVMTHTQFRHLPSTGWLRTMPLTFTPEFDDSTMTYAIALAVRHDNSYPFCNLCLAVDVCATDSTVSRKRLDVTLADEYGNWTSGGFGSLYQKKVSVATGLKPSDAQSVVVWQVMGGCDTLHGVVDVGVSAIPE